MARSLTDAEQRPADVATAAQRRRIDRSTARALAAALSALAVSAVVVGTSSEALVRHGTAATSELHTGTISLTDDDQGRSLVELETMAPGRPVSQCIEVTYTGTILPVDLTLNAESVGDIADYVDLTIDRGWTGGFDDCGSFLRNAHMYQGTLASLVDDGVHVGSFGNVGDRMTFRIRFDLVDEAAAAGRSGTVDFVWEAVPA